mmetsp:Transcript_19497/g.23355  ORF Transcript_19497/g.23355 Transcript_19497/m.23355 type:complete len:561 (+) Transcript_19497:29-1711(+)|eukprot:CAMPEP_0197849610 /NCGR_PEP_ID=MMETSP1438-20131217/12690_1 /TAXON_ID=1461541 /ORGANISM="Pterosperma sp., Strain CCMP1384" /LENGTH=560 /DNA_ID=CAMNT_0043462383 /DNA_START=29 /DNA_END=1711 /DNA_ORIENTATION=+
MSSSVCIRSARVGRTGLEGSVADRSHTAGPPGRSFVGKKASPSDTAYFRTNKAQVATRGTRLEEVITVSPSQMEAIKTRPISEAAASSAIALQQFQANGGGRGAEVDKSSIIVIGLSVHTAPVEFREKLAVPQAEWTRAIAELCSFPHVEEAGVLSTCNRMEIYAVGLSWHLAVREIEEWMSQASGLSVEELRTHLFLLRDRDATSHLLTVSAGLDSLVLGEGQILAQVKSVYEEGQKAVGFGRHLNGLFKAAITAGKRVRTETSIASGAVSVSSAAAELCQMKLPTNDFSAARICIVGAGKMSRLLVKHLVSKGCDKMVVLNRSLPRAEELAADFPEANIEIHLMDQLMPQVEAADCIFFAASSDDPLICKADLAKMEDATEGVGGVRRLFDIAVPRNVAADVNDLGPQARLYNVDDLKEVVELNKGARAKAADEARGLLKQEQQAFESWRDSLETVPTIKRLRGKAEDIRSAELEKALKKMGGDDNLTKKQRKALEDLSRGIVNKLLHGPMQCLRSDGTDATAVSETLVNMHALEKMFDLRPEVEAAHKWTAPTKAQK